MHEVGSLVVHFVVWLFILSCRSANSACTRALEQSQNPRSPHLQISIAEYPDDHVIPVGYDVTIVCTSNISALVYRVAKIYLQIYWMSIYFYDNKITACGGTEADREDSKTCKFVIKNSTAKDAGLYFCQAHNDLSCTETSINLTFQEPWAPHFTAHPRRQLNISAGQSANLSCEASGLPKPAITWFKDGRPLPRASIKTEKGFSMLTFDSASPRDHGLYWCDARSIEGENRSSVANVTVSFKPVFSVHPANISVHENANVTLSCEATGFPSPVIGWLKNNMPVLNATLAENATFSSLTLQFVQEEKVAGKYSCLARNSQGQTISKEGRLTILYQPDRSSAFSFYHHPKSIEASHGTSVRFTCSLRGLKLPVIKWLKDGKPFKDSNADTSQTNGTSALRIWSVHQTHVGHYWCVATSSGWNATSKKARLSLKESKEGIDVIWFYLGAAIVVFVFFLLGLICFIQKRCTAPSYRPSQQMVDMNQKQMELNSYTQTPRIISSNPTILVDTASKPNSY